MRAGLIGGGTIARLFLQHIRAEQKKVHCWQQQNDDEGRSLPFEFFRQRYNPWLFAYQKKAM